MSINHSISVILPVYNGGKFIAEAINSVFDQNYKPLEIIVVDDGSTDNTKDVLKQYRDKITYIYQENKGSASARNTALDAAGNDFISFIDADDIWHPEKLKTQFALFEKFKSLEIAMGITAEFDSVINRELLHNSVKKFRPVLGSALFKKTVFDKIGTFDEEMILGQDGDLFMRARENYISIATHNDVVLYYRRHENNVTNNIQKYNYYIFKAIKKAKDRRKNPESALRLFPDQKPESMEELMKLWHTVDMK
jgi:glycosyltransferase involved in cell wall biosynthesis